MVFVCSIAESSPAPDWVLGRGHPSYDPSQYLMGVGHSDKSSTSASESARAELIKSISINISSTLKDYNSTEKSFSESSIHTSTDFLLEGSKVKDGWYDEERDIYYSFVVIKRQYVLDTLLSIIDLNFEKNLLALKQGDEFYSNGDILKSLVYYYDGYVDSLKLFPYIQTYNSVILDTNNKLLDKKYVLNLIFKDKIEKITDSISIKSINKSVKGDSADFGVVVLLNNKPISDFPVKFFSAYKHFIERIMCESSGCSVNVKIKDIVRSDRIHLRASIDVKSLSRYFSFPLEDSFFRRMELVSVHFKTKLEKVVPDNPFVAGNKPQTYESQVRKQRAFRQLHDETLAWGLRGYSRRDVAPLRNSDVNWRIGVRTPNMDIRIGN